MSQALDTIISVQISAKTQSITQQGFGTPLILGQHTRFGERARKYSSLDGMIADGFLTSDAEYVHAAKLLSQELTVEQFVVGRRTAPVAQVVTSTPDVTVQAIAHFIQTINGVAYDFTSDATPTAAEVVTGLIALINADTNCKVTASGTTTLILTADTAGIPFTHSESPNLVAVATTANNGVVEDLKAVTDLEDDYYAIILTSKVKAEILELASYVETLFKIFIAGSQDAGVPDSTVSDDVMSLLKALGYNRTGLVYHTAEGAQAVEAGWLGGELPKEPGSSTYKFKPVVGATADKFTANQLATLIGSPGNPGKNANIYRSAAGQSFMGEGWMASGMFIDNQIVIDWTHARLQEAIFALLVSEDKVPFTDDGGAMIENAMRAVFERGVKNGAIAPGSYTISIPKVLDVPAQDRANRLLSGIKFSYRLAGAFHYIKIQGTVTV